MVNPLAIGPGTFERESTTKKGTKTLDGCIRHNTFKDVFESTKEFLDVLEHFPRCVVLRICVAVLGLYSLHGTNEQLIFKRGWF